MINLFDKRIYEVDFCVIKKNIELNNKNIFENNDIKLKERVENNCYLEKKMSLLVQKDIDSNYMCEIITGEVLPVVMVGVRKRLGVIDNLEYVEVSGKLNSPYFIYIYTYAGNRFNYYTSIKAVGERELKDYLTKYRDRTKLEENLRQIKEEARQDLVLVRAKNK